MNTKKREVCKARQNRTADAFAAITAFKQKIRDEEDYVWLHFACGTPWRVRRRDYESDLGETP